MNTQTSHNDSRPRDTGREVRGEKGMLEKAFNEVYSKFKLHFYRKVFANLENSSPNLTAIETFCVEAIYALNKPTVNKLARYINISQPNAAYKIANLEKKGYIRKIKSEEDRREYHLVLTEKFEDYYGINYEYIKTVIGRIKERFPEEDVKKFESMLCIISEELMNEASEGFD